MIKVLIGTTVRQQPEILKEYLHSLKSLNKENIICDYLFVDDNNDIKSKNLLTDFRDNNLENSVYLIESDSDNIDYIKDENTHHWREELVWKVAKNKNIILEYALKNGYDYVFLVDSDIVLHPATLQHLLSLKKILCQKYFGQNGTIILQNFLKYGLVINTIYFIKEGKRKLQPKS